MSRLCLLLAAVIGLSFVYSQSCPKYWFGFDGYCYRYFTALNSWRAAQDICATYGANLASIHGDEENSFIHKLQGSCLNNIFWIGLSDEENEGDFRWIDGTELVYSNWNPGEPDDYLEQDCVVFGGTTGEAPWKWNDTFCSDNHHFVCKWLLP
ncbi:C-type lectin domain family 19 member A-like [Ptychodera flava]|uniref:C-type lectin domain family 19 member A-like n=1 Tax=Ptychodera flava TaxID=63121 RepID=UPI00396A21B5